MHSTLLVGPYDWDARRLAKEEFNDRIQAFWSRIPDEACTAAVVYGDSRSYAELAYLSNFTPKLGPALMLLPRSGEPTLLVSGAANMLAAARRLTWVEKTQPLGDAGKTIRQWLLELFPSGTCPRAALINGKAMRSALYRPLGEALGAGNALVDESSALRALMRYKRPAELVIIREACAILNAATRTLKEAQRAGAGVTEACLAGERVAYESGAQDVRMLFSLDGGRTLRPFEAVIDRTVEPLQTYSAVRHAGYWVEGLVLSAASSHPVLEKVDTALRAIVKTAQPGVKCSELARIAVERIQPYGEHAITRGNMGNSIGLFLEEEPRLRGDGLESLEAGCVYSLRVGASDGQNLHAMVSAMVALHDTGNDVLWSSR